MKRIRVPVLSGALLLSFALAAAASAADFKIGFIDSEKIFAAYKGTNQAQSEFNSDIEKWTQELDSKQRDLQQARDEYQNQSLILSEAKKREREEELQQKQSDLDAFKLDIWGPSGKVAQRNDQLTRPIIEKIKQVLTDLGENEGYSIIFDATDGNVVYADHALDLTDEVIRRVNALQDNQLPSTSTPK
jgi:outer membrane protein